MRRAVAHEDERRAVLGRRRQGRRRVVAFIAGIRRGRRRDRLRDRRLVLIDHSRVLADFAQKRLRHADGLEITRDGIHGFHELVVLRAVHQVCRLDDEILHAICLRARQCLRDVVDLLAVPGLHMVDDDLGRERPAHGPVRIGLLDSLLDSADILCAAVVEGGAEAHHQDLVLADLIRVQRIVQGGVACVAAEIIGIRFLAFHKLLLFVRQRIPAGLRRLDLRVSLLGPFLDINRIDHSCHGIRRLLIGRGLRRLCRGSGLPF